MAKRRGHGEGSVYRRRDGRWAAAVSVDYSQGRRRRKTVYGRTQGEVVRKLQHLRSQNTDQLRLSDDHTRVGQFLEWWVTESLPRLVRPATVDNYATIVRRHIVPELGQVRLSALVPQQVERLLQQKLRELSPRTVQLVHAVLRRALGQAERWGLVSRNVARLVDPPRVPRPDHHPLDPEQARQLLAAADDDRLHALYAVALAVGLRKGEALALKWSDIDFARQTLMVRGTLQRQRAGNRSTLVVSEPKSARSRRTIFLPETCSVALQKHRQRQLEERLIAGRSWQDSGFVFTTATGTPIDPRNLLRHFHRVCDRAGLRRRSFHSLRHTAATLLLAQNVHPRVVMEVLGHSGIGITMDLYSHVLPTLEREAASRVDELLTG